MADLFATLAHRVLAQPGVRPRTPSRFERDGLAAQGVLEVRDHEVVADESPTPSSTPKRTIVPEVEPPAMAIDPPVARPAPVPRERASSTRVAEALNLGRPSARVAMPSPVADPPRVVADRSPPLDAPRSGRVKPDAAAAPPTPAIERSQTERITSTPVAPPTTVVHRHEAAPIERLVVPTIPLVERTRIYDRLVERSVVPSAEAPQPAPRIDIQIGRIDVRAPAPTVVPTREAPSTAPRPRSLDELLATRRTPA